MGRATPGIAFFCVLLFVLAAGCGGPATAPPEKGASSGTPAAVPVVLVRPKKETLRRTIEQPGRIDPDEQAPLYVKIAGYVEKVHVDIGDHVQKDQVLAVLRVPEMVQELEQKKALVKQAEAEVKQAEAALEAAGANMATAAALVEEAKAGRKRAQADLDRWNAQFLHDQDLVRRKVLDQQSFEVTGKNLESAKAAREEVEAKVRSAEALRDESKARRDKAAADVSAAQARVEVAQADQRRMAELVEYAKVKAPFDGVVTRRNVDTGHFLQPAPGGRAEPIFIVVRTDPVRVVVDVPGADAIWVANGLKAWVRIQGLRGEEFEGKVTRSAWSLDSQARTLRTEIELPNGDGKLRPGMYAYAGIAVEHAGVWTLPASAVLTQGDQAFVYRVDGGKAVRMPVKVGVRAGPLVEVHKKQTKDGAWQAIAGEEEVARDARALTEGQSVTAEGK